MKNKWTICSIGAGRMGRGIAHAFAYAGFPVQLVDLKAREKDATRALEEQAFGEIRSNLAVLAALGMFSESQIEHVLARISFVPAERIAEELPKADFVFEGVPERIDAKREAFSATVPHLRDDVVIASTTSTILSTELAKHVDHPERFLNAHWLNPAFLIPLVELSPHAGTDERTVKRLYDLLRGIGKVPVRCAAEPGYIIPRFQTLIMLEAARMIEQGTATAEDIDKATRFGFGIRYAGMGVVEFIDFGGNDTLYNASNYLADSLQADRYRPPEIVSTLMKEGRNGLRDGRGFYDWAGRDIDRYRHDVMQRLVNLLRLQDCLPVPADDEVDQ
ncbi:MAG: 3-hydroxybutyryl-CoA dehydrogenase [Steroidobacteraceae bacterium]